MFELSKKTTLITCAVLYFLSQVLFLVNIQFPRGYNFDEFHYVPSAKQYLEMKENRNWEHPPLGKEIMAVGIAIGQDRPFGWRLMSTLFGTVTLIAMYLGALALFKNQRAALLTVALTLTNQLLYVQARIGMLDTMMFAFIACALAAFFYSWDPGRTRAENRKLLAFLGLMLGLATATKWWGVVPWTLILGLIIFVRLLQFWKTSFGNKPTANDWYHPELWKGIPPWELAAWLVALPLVAYFSTFVPLLYVEGSQRGFWDLFAMQKQMWEGQLRVVTAHPYMSNWWDWAILNRPIWYAFDKEDPNETFVRGVILLGNPLIMWGGLLAVGSTLWDWFTHRRREAFLISVFYLAFYFSWLAIPRKISFYYYYYPAGMLLSFALAWVFTQAEKQKPLMTWATTIFLGACLGMFIYFFPILAALRIPADSFRKWMWLASWI